MPTMVRFASCWMTGFWMFEKMEPNEPESAKADFGRTPRQSEKLRQETQGGSPSMT
jgi:hypothetical protein